MRDNFSVRLELYPFISVIVPVFNYASGIQTCIEALLGQTYPQDCYEVIVVDNGSTDNTLQVIRQYPVTCLTEDGIRSSYTARNRGIKVARGEIIAFTDSDCTPVPQWLVQGVSGLYQQSADLCSGNVRFVYSENPGGAEIFDSIGNMQIEQNIRERNVSKTANLFVRAAILEKVGLFPANLQSGGDVIWTGRATGMGFKLVYVPSAEVAHPARRLGDLLKKQYRVGKGQHAIWVETSSSLMDSIKPIINNFLPISFSNISRRLEQRGIDISRTKLWRVWLAAWLCRLATVAGNIMGMKNLIG